MCGGIVIFPLLIAGWLAFCRRTNQTNKLRNIGLTLAAALFLIPAISMGKFMFIDDALLSASKAGDFEAVKHAISWGAAINLDDEGRTPLGEAIENDHEEIALYLLDKGADPNMLSYDMPPVKAARLHNLPHVVAALEAKGAK